VRWSRYALAPALVMGAAILSAFPALYNGTYYGKNLDAVSQELAEFQSQ